MLKEIMQYLKNITGLGVENEKIRQSFSRQLPLYLKNAFDYNMLEIEGKKLMLAEIKGGANFTTSQLNKHKELIEGLSGFHLLFGINDMEAFQRKRLVQQKIPFVVPGKQLFIPFLFIDFNETKKATSTLNRKSLSPAAQYLLLYHLQIENLSEYNFQVIADKVGYSKMTITRIAKELEGFKICKIAGPKDKYLEFEFTKKELWNNAQQILINPILQTYFANEIPLTNDLMKAGESALEKYSDISSAQLKTYALSRDKFLLLKKNSQIKDINSYEGKYRIEVWSYDPDKLCKGKTVDRLSLYLTLKDMNDERIEMALDEMIKEIKW